MPTLFLSFLRLTELLNLLSWELLPPHSLHHSLHHSLPNSLLPL